MPKPFFLARPSGLFVRFLVPADLRDRLGARFVVRRLYAPRGDAARLAAAHMAAALSEVFEQVRRGVMADFDIKDILDKARRGQLRDLTLRDVTLNDGTRLGSVEINTPADRALFDALRGSPGNVSRPAPQAPAPKPVEIAPSTPAPLPILISNAIQDYRDARAIAKLTGDVDVNNTLRIFSEMIGDKDLSHVTRADILSFEKAIANWPANARKQRRYRDKTAPDIVRDAQERQIARDTTLELLSDNARRKHRDTLAAFFNWAVVEEMLAKSPMKGGKRQQDHRIERKQVRRPFRSEELALIFNSATFLPWTEDKPHYFWAPWIALYSGARLNEVAQIYLNDIQVFHGIAGFTIFPRRKDQRVKSSSSPRFIPFAQSLIDAGLLTYIEEVREAGHHRLFPHLKYGDDYGDYLGDRFIVYLEKIGLKVAENPDAPGMGFHWFRHTVGTAVVNTLTNTLSTAASITGHGKGTIMPGELATYVEPAEVRQKFEAVNNMSLPKPPPYVPGTFATALQAAHNLPAKWAREDAKRDDRRAVGGDTKAAKARAPRNDPKRSA